MSASKAVSAVPERPAVMGKYKPYWIEKPDGADMSSFYPARAARHDINGRARIKCVVAADGRLADCRVLSESPPGEGFGAAAVALSSKFRLLPPDVPAGASPPEITIPIVFEIPAYNRRVSPRPESSEIKPAPTGVQALIGGKAQEGLMTKVLINAIGAPPIAVAGLALAILVVLVLILNRKRGQGRDL
jgi:TonB family protein